MEGAGKGPECIKTLRERESVRVQRNLKCINGCMIISGIPGIHVPLELRLFRIKSRILYGYRDIRPNTLLGDDLNIP